MKKQINKKKLAMFVLPILAIALVSALLVSNFAQVQREVEITASYESSGDIISNSLSVEGGESVISDELWITSLNERVVLPLSIITTATPDEEGLTSTVNYLLDNSAGTCANYPAEGWRNECEKRIFISAEDVGIETLNDLNSISWDVNVLGGYIAHVDVILETDALVFEYAKVNPSIGCDDVGNYPTGEQNTFGNKGIVDVNAYAWLNSGVSGGCTTPEFMTNWKTLTEWKSTRGTEKVIGFEIEVDNWMELISGHIYEGIGSNSEVKNILINGVEVEVSLKPLDSLNFNIETEFGIVEPETYIITTKVIPRE